MTRPADVPEKFWDDEVGAVRIDALVKSYLELERKLGSGRREPEPETLPPLEVETPPEALVDGEGPGMRFESLRRN